MAQVKTAKFEISPDWAEILNNADGPVERSLTERVGDLEGDVEFLRDDRLDTYHVFKAKDQKVRRRVRELEDGQTAILDNIDLIYDYIADLGKRLDAVEQPVKVVEINADAPVPRDEVGAAIEALNEALGFAKGWPQVNLGTLRRLAGMGYVSGSVKDNLPL